MDPFRTCIHCQQRIKLSYQEGDNKRPLVFIVHTMSDFVTPCIGSRQRADNQAIIESVVSLEHSIASESKPVVQPPLPQPVLQVRPEHVPKDSVVCTSCGKAVRTMKGGRGNTLYIQHYNNHGQNCLNSLKPV